MFASNYLDMGKLESGGASAYTHLCTWTVSVARQKQQAFTCISSLFGRAGDIEFEVDNVTVLHYIVLAFLSKFAGCLDLHFCFKLM